MSANIIRVVAQPTPSVLVKGDIPRYDGSSAFVNSPRESFNVRDYGAVGNGTTDDTAAIQAAITAAAATNVRAVLFSGVYRITAGLTVGQSSMRLFSPGGMSFLYIDGAITAITVANTDSRCVIENIGIIPYENGDKGTFTGIHLSAAQNCTINNIYMTEPSVGIKLTGGCYHNSISNLSFYNCYSKGIWLDAASGESPNANNIHFKCLLNTVGAIPASSVGIHVEHGSANIFSGNEIAYWETPFKAEEGGNTFRDCWLEGNTYGVTAAGGATTIMDIHTSDMPHVVSGTGVYQFPNGPFAFHSDYSPARPSTYGLKALYMCNEGTGTLLHDLSGNAADVNESSGSWVQGLYGNALRLSMTSDAGGHIDLDPTLIDPTDPWTIAILWKPSVLAGSSGQMVYMDDGTHWQMLRVPDVGSWYNMLDSNAVNIPLSSMNHAARWCWLFITYTPGTGVATSLDPVIHGDAGMTGTIANIVTPTLAALQIHKNPFAFEWAADYQLIAIWQRALTIEEASGFIDGAHWLSWAATIAAA